jgi:ankyrin repeat protein
MTALTLASHKGHLEVVAMLLEKGANIEATDHVSYCDAMYGV